MLLSKHIKLIAAFNHAHIFIDPDPDPAVSYPERRRLFGLPHSNWTDYDASKLSEGGGIFSRQSKRIGLHPRARALLKLSKSTITPPELIRAILRAKSDLLWNGGIGTYVKASTESHLDAGDPANDAVRIDAKALRCRVVGEGGNLGFTQRARIEFALGGGLINTDFIDNSGGVDSSDREVNIKILLGLAIEQGHLARSKRDALLAGMTDEVARQVLENNYAQTQALSMMSVRNHERLGESVRLIKALESRGVLDRALEHLPSEEDIEARRKAGRGLTRPELAIILSYSKTDLYTRLVDTDIPKTSTSPVTSRAIFHNDSNNGSPPPSRITACAARSSPGASRAAWSTAWAPPLPLGRRRIPAAASPRSPAPTRSCARSSMSGRCGRTSRISTTTSGLRFSTG